MVDREKVVEGLEMSYAYSNVDDGNTLVPQQLVLDALELLKAQEPIVPIRRNAHAHGSDDVWYECGKCGEFLSVNRYSIKQFCAKCGQAVKWDG